MSSHRHLTHGAPHTSQRTSDSNLPYTLMMRNNAYFFDKSQLSAPCLSYREFTILLNSIADCEVHDHEIRHEFLLKLAQTIFLDVGGPVMGTLQKAIDTDTEDALMKRGYDILLRILEEMVIRLWEHNDIFLNISEILDVMSDVKPGLKTTEHERKLVDLKAFIEDKFLIDNEDLIANNLSDSVYLSEALPEFEELMALDKLDRKFTNKLGEAYASAAEYLEIWYRMTKEDHLRPFRICLRDYLDNRSSKYHETHTDESEEANNDSECEVTKDRKNDDGHHGLSEAAMNENVQDDGDGNRKVAQQCSSRNFVTTMENSGENEMRILTNEETNPENQQTGFQEGEEPRIHDGTSILERMSAKASPEEARRIAGKSPSKDTGTTLDNKDADFQNEETTSENKGVSLNNNDTTILNEKGRVGVKEGHIENESEDRNEYCDCDNMETVVQDKGADVTNIATSQFSDDDVLSEDVSHHDHETNLENDDAGEGRGETNDMKGKNKTESGDQNEEMPGGSNNGDDEQNDDDDKDVNVIDIDFRLLEILAKDRSHGKTVYLVRISASESDVPESIDEEWLKTDSLLAIFNEDFSSARYATISFVQNAEPADDAIWIAMLDQKPLEIPTPLHAVQISAFYEPYRCVLDRIRLWAARSNRGVPLPLERRIVECDNRMEPPTYLPLGTEISLLNDGVAKTGQIEHLGVDMDAEEVAAVNHALTSELAIIIGPQGTGKSFVGVHIVKLLMKNKTLWKKYGHGSLLILGMNNRDIDRFFMNCERFGVDMAASLRIGSRGDASIRKYLLRNKRHKVTSSTMLDLKRENGMKMEELLNLQKKVEACKRALSATDFEIPEEYIGYANGFRLRQKYKCIRADSAQMKHVLISWMYDFDELDLHAELPDLDSVRPMSQSEAFQCSLNLFSIAIEDRRRLYKFWCEQARELAAERIEEFEEEIVRLKDDIHELKMKMDVCAVRGCDIMAMTTTGASKHAHLLEAARPVITITVESSLVLEPHVLAALTPSCQHLIVFGVSRFGMVGGLLYPGFADIASLGRNFHCPMYFRNLFAKFPYVTLKTQHRIHPEICQFIRPLLPSVATDESLYKLPPICGMKERVCFLQYDNPKESQLNELHQSERLRFQARFLFGLARYLLLQGYKPSDMSIVCRLALDVPFVESVLSEMNAENPDPFYSTEEKVKRMMEDFQEFLSASRTGMQENTTRRWLSSQKDQYQLRQATLNFPVSKFKDISVTDSLTSIGAESEIVLLLFDSSQLISDGESILSVCLEKFLISVARSRSGLFAIGDFNVFTTMTSSSEYHKKVAAQVAELLEAQKGTYFGKSMSIVCQCHGNSREVTDADSLLAASPDGGCGQVCDLLLPCGHRCPRMCHPDDQNHSLYRCNNPCKGRLSCGHACSKICHQSSDGGQSANNRACSGCGKFVACPVEVNVLPCGHPGRSTCSSNENSCGIDIKITRTCGHSLVATCSKKNEILSTVCEETVVETMHCGHEITRSCSEQGKCSAVVARVLVCGHTANVECGAGDEFYRCNEFVNEKLDCGHTNRRRCYQKPECQFLVLTDMACGHRKRVRCTGGRPLREKCDGCQSMPGRRGRTMEPW